MTGPQELKVYSLPGRFGDRALAVRTGYLVPPRTRKKMKKKATISYGPITYLLLLLLISCIDIGKDVKQKTIIKESRALVSDTCTKVCSRRS